MWKRTIWFWLSCLFLVSVGSSAEENIAMITSMTGSVTSQGTQLEILDFVKSDQKATLERGSTATFSYVAGGKRFTVQGPCTVRFSEQGPQKAGSGGGIQGVVPSKRQGTDLTSSFNLDFGGQVRRGEVHLHMSRALLPGGQVIDVTATPAFTSFYFSVFDSTQRKFQSEELTESEWKVPDGVLKPGETYEFILEATTDSGRREVIRATNVRTLDSESAKIVRQAMEARQEESDMLNQIELLAIFLRFELDSLFLA